MRSLVVAALLSTGRASWSDVLIALGVLLAVTAYVGLRRRRDARSDPGPRVPNPTRAELEQAITLTFRRDHVGIARGDVGVLADSFAKGEWPGRAGIAQSVRLDNGVGGARIRTLLTDRRLLLLGASPTRRAPGEKTIAFDLKGIASVSALAGNEYTVSLANGRSIELRVYGSAQPLLRRVGSTFYDSLRAARST